MNELMMMMLIYTDSHTHTEAHMHAEPHNHTPLSDACI